jgi:glycerol kinase
VVFVPALTGLGAPDWDPVRARADRRDHPRDHAGAPGARHPGGDRVRGARRGRPDAARVGIALPQLTVDGGASANDLLCQLQADQLGVPVLRPEILETTGLGAAFLAGLGTGVWNSTDELARTWRLERRFEPGTRDEVAHRRWRSAVERSKGWAAEV